MIVELVAELVAVEGNQAVVVDRKHWVDRIVEVVEVAVVAEDILVVVVAVVVAGRRWVVRMH